MPKMTLDEVLAELARAPEPLRPLPIDEGTVDNIVRLLAAQRGIPPADAARELLCGLAHWFGIDFAREAERAEDAAERE